MKWIDSVADARIRVSNEIVHAHDHIATVLCDANIVSYCSLFLFYR